MATSLTNPKDPALTMISGRVEAPLLATESELPAAASGMHDDAWTVRSALNSAAAGYVAGVAGVVMGHPLDSAKVWLQTNSSGQNKYLSTKQLSHTLESTSSGHPSSIRSAVSSSSVASSSKTATTAATANMSTMSVSGTFQARSSPPSLTTAARTIRALYSGVSVPLVTVGLVQSANFAAYDAVRRTLHRRDRPNCTSHDYLQNDSLKNVAIAGLCSGSVLAFLTAPLVLVKTRQQITGNGFRQTFWESLQGSTRRLPACFVGFAPHLLSETVGRAVYYATYEASKRGMAQWKVRNDSNDNVVGKEISISLTERMLSAGFAGIVCWSIIFPFDSLRSRLYGQTGPNPLSTMNMALSVYHESGMMGFYRGFGITVLRAGPVAAVVLPIYDLVLDSLVARE